MVIKFFKKVIADVEESALIRRASRLSTPDLSEWMNTSVLYLGRALDSWRYHDGPIGDVTDGVTAVQIIWTELESRESK